MRTHLIAGVTACLLASISAAAPNLGDKLPKWEYAELKLMRSFAGGVAIAPIAPGGAGAVLPPAANRAQPKTAVTWATLDGETEAETWEELANKIKAPSLTKEGGSATMQKLRVLNFLGAEGWEIVDHSGGDGVTTNGSWTLKRRVP